jgi:hypothetical protein
MNTYVKKIHDGDSLNLSEDDNNNIIIDIYDANCTSDTTWMDSILTVHLEQIHQSYDELRWFKKSAR